MAGRCGTEKRPGGRSLTSDRADGHSKVLLVFIDGVGIGSKDPERNPLAAARLPAFEALLGGARPIVEDLAAGPIVTSDARLLALDATLGIAGRPQSGTGQTAILTGHNAPELLGRHFGPWVPTDLRDLLAAENLFSRARLSGNTVAFANAYPAAFVAPGEHGDRRPGAFPFAARAASSLTRNEEDVRAGRALVSSITTERWREHVDSNAPHVSPAEAARILATLAGEHDLTVFAHYDTDFVGHGRDMAAGVAAIERVDAFLGALVQHLPTGTLLLLTSDHGNLEDVATGHTTNMVPLLVVGTGGAELSREVGAITEVAPLILEILDVASGSPGRGARSRG